MPRTFMQIKIVYLYISEIVRFWGVELVYAYENVAERRLIKSVRCRKYGKYGMQNTTARFQRFRHIVAGIAEELVEELSTVRSCSI